MYYYYYSKPFFFFWLHNVVKYGLKDSLKKLSYLYGLKLATTDFGFATCLYFTMFTVAMMLFGTVAKEMTSRLPQSHGCSCNSTNHMVLLFFLYEDFVGKGSDWIRRYPNGYSYIYGKQNLDDCSSFEVNKI